MSKLLLHLTTLIFGAIVIFSFSYYLKLYFVDYPTYAADYWGWQYGPREIVVYFKTHQQEYDEFYLQPEFNAPEIFLKFYAPEGECAKCFIGIPKDKIDPAKRQLFAITPKYLSENGARTALQPWYLPISLTRANIQHQSTIRSNSPPRSHAGYSWCCDRLPVKSVRRIYYPNGNLAFFLVTP